MIPGACLALRKKFLNEGVYNLVVLRMNLDKRSAFLCFSENFVKNAVLYAEVIYHKHLKGRNAEFYALLNGVKQVSAYVLYCHMV